jgi:transketolase N-terminal domain/subunit
MATGRVHEESSMRIFNILTTLYEYIIMVSLSDQMQITNKHACEIEHRSYPHATGRVHEESSMRIFNILTTSYEYIIMVSLSEQMQK